MRRILVLVMVAVMVFALCACGGGTGSGDAAAPEKKVLRVGMECAYAPNNWLETTDTDTNLPISNVEGSFAEGYDVQMARRIAENAGYEVEIVMLSWDGLIEALNQGQIDLIIAGMADTAERRESINFSDPYHVTEYGILLNKDSAFASATSIHEFAGACVLGQKDTQLDTVIDQMEGVDHLTPVNSVPNMISRLQEGTCDAIVVNVESSRAYLDSNPNFALIRFEEGKGFDLGFTGACVGIRKADTALLEEINAALAKIDDATRTELWNAAEANQPA
ncbi:MAG: transporter substrate-binding domain-containing protein [Clostridia bacterium]|nr:transporter substrate-binding domain-containing protein [Clostridia bacterium]